MRDGRWKLNGEPIVISVSGQVLSGRLRLEACLLSDSAFDSLVVHGVEDDTFTTIDALRKRTLSDILTIRNEPNGRALGSALTTLWRYGAGWTLKGGQVSSQQLLGLLEANPELRTSLLLVRDCSPALPHGTAAAAHYLFSCVDAARATQFFAEFVEEPSSSSPPHKLKKSLLELREQGGARSPTYVFGITIKAWEAYRSERPLIQLKFAANEDFPKITNLPDNLALDGRALSPQIQSHAPISIGNSIKVVAQTMTPEEAKGYLQNNNGNRRIAAPVVQRYKRDMEARNWLMNGQTIKFGSSGRLLDGQHRLAACVESGVSFPALVVTGLDETVFDTFDLGTKRSMGDILVDRGEANTSTLAATLRQLWLLKKNLLQVRVISPSIAEMLDLLEREPEVRRSVSLGNRIRELAAPSLACALHYLFSRKDAELAEQFIFRLGDGVALEARSPIYALRERLIRDRSTRKRSMADPEKAALFIKAWNALRSGLEVAALRWVSGREEFPKIL
jgi:hypothetical protein